MSNFVRTFVAILAASFAAGCANQNVKPVEVICPILGGIAGAAIAAGAFDGNDSEGAMAGGAAVGAGLAWFLCRDKEEAAQPAPRPAPAPRAAPKPQPKPAPAKDSDGDGVVDPKDQCPGTPAGTKVNASGCPEVGEMFLSLKGVNFDTNKATIKAESESVLDGAIEALQANPSVHVRVEGHTDSSGSEAYNRRLSQRRAEAVVAYMVAKGVGAERLSAVGYGESSPIAPNDTPENMAKNRRVDLVVTDS